MNEKQTKKVKVLIIIVIVIIVIVLGITYFFGKVNSNLDKLTNETFAEIDLSKIPDGTYSGKYSTFPVLAEVEVLIENGQINTIKILKHNNGKGEDAEGIINEVIEEQRIDVDIVSGATYSSVVIKKAIENALIDMK